MAQMQGAYGPHPRNQPVLPPAQSQGTAPFYDWHETQEVPLPHHRVWSRTSTDMRLCATSTTGTFEVLSVQCVGGFGACTLISRHLHGHVAQVPGTDTDCHLESMAACTTRHVDSRDPRPWHEGLGHHAAPQTPVLVRVQDRTTMRPLTRRSWRGSPANGPSGCGAPVQVRRPAAKAGRPCRRPRAERKRRPAQQTYSGQVDSPRMSGGWLPGAGSAKSGGPAFPVTVENLRQVAASFKAGNYRSVQNYMHAALWYQDSFLAPPVEACIKKAAKRLARAAVRGMPGSKLASPHG